MQHVAYIAPGKQVTIHEVEMDRPWMWVVEGWRDLQTSPLVSLLHGGVIALFFAGITFLLLNTRWFDSALSLAAGFIFIGPVVAVNLYAISRCIEQQKPINARNAFLAWRENSTQIMAFGVILMLILVAWMRLTTLWFAIFFETPVSSWSLFISSLFSLEGLPFLAVFIGSGLIVSIIVFAFSAFSVPMLLDRKDMDAVNALLISYDAVRSNWKSMTLWALLISVFTGIGLFTFYLGLIVTLPLIGHATWHAYRETISD